MKVKITINIPKDVHSEAMNSKGHLSFTAYVIEALIKENKKRRK